MNLTELVGQTRIKKHPFRGSGFTRVHVRHDADVPVPGNGGRASHHALRSEIESYRANPKEILGAIISNDSAKTLC